MKLAGHTCRHEDLDAHKVLFWDPRILPIKSYVDILHKDTGLGETVE